MNHFTHKRSHAPVAVPSLQNLIVAHDNATEMTYDQMFKVLNLTMQDIKDTSPAFQRHCMLYLTDTGKIEANLRAFASDNRKHFPPLMRIFFFYRFGLFPRLACISTLKSEFVIVDHVRFEESKLRLPAHSCRLLGYKK